MLLETTYHWKATTSDFTREIWTESIKEKEKFGSQRKTEVQPEQQKKEQKQPVQLD